MREKDIHQGSKTGHSKRKTDFLKIVKKVPSRQLLFQKVKNKQLFRIKRNENFLLK